MSERWDIILADEHVLLLDGLAAMLRERGHSVLAAVSRWDDAIAALRSSRPRLCIVEPALQDGGGAGDIAALVAASPNTFFVVLTAEEGPEQLNGALSSGAAGYVHKTRGMTTLLDVLERVCAGEIVIEGSFSRRQDLRESEPPSELVLLAAQLTPRERECLGLLTQGHATAGISATLGVSRTTVRTHVQSVLTKLGVHSRLEAAALAVRYGLVEPTQRTPHRLVRVAGSLTGRDDLRCDPESNVARQLPA